MRYRRLVALTCLASLAVAACSGTPKARRPNPNSDVDRAGVSPAEFERLLEEDKTRLLQQIWKRLGITSELFASTQPYFEVDRVPIGRLSTGESCVLVRITDPLKWDWQYLVFGRGGDGRWVFKGNIDMPRQNDGYDPPPHKTVWIGSGGPWLVVRHKTGGGTGFALYEDTWYHLESDPIREVLMCPAGGHETNLPPYGIRFSAKLFGTATKEGTPTILMTYDLEYVNTYWRDMAVPDPLFRETRRASFKWNPATHRFELDPADSDVTQEEVRGILDYRPADLLKRHYDEFLKLAGRSDPAVQEWVRMFMKGCEDCEQKERLVRILASPPE